MFEEFLTKTDAGNMIIEALGEDRDCANAVIEESVRVVCKDFLEKHVRSNNTTSRYDANPFGEFLKEIEKNAKMNVGVLSSENYSSIVFMKVKKPNLYPRDSLRNPRLSPFLCDLIKYLKNGYGIEHQEWTPVNLRGYKTDESNMHVPYDLKVPGVRKYTVSILNCMLITDSGKPRVNANLPLFIKTDIGTYQKDYFKNGYYLDGVRWTEEIPEKELLDYLRLQSTQVQSFNAFDWVYKAVVSYYEDNPNLREGFHIPPNQDFPCLRLKYSEANKTLKPFIIQAIDMEHPDVFPEGYRYLNAVKNEFLGARGSGAKLADAVFISRSRTHKLDMLRDLQFLLNNNVYCLCGKDAFDNVIPQESITVELNSIEIVDDSTGEIIPMTSIIEEIIQEHYNG